MRLQFLFRALFRPALDQFRRSRGLLALAGLMLAIAGMAFASDTQKVDTPAAVSAKAPADPTCKVPGAGEPEKAAPAMSSTDSSPDQENEASPAEDSMKIKSDLAAKPQAEDESAQDAAKREGADTADSLSEKAKTAAPLQCERPAAKKDLTLPASGKDGSPE